MATNSTHNATVVFDDYRITQKAKREPILSLFVYH